MKSEKADVVRAKRACEKDDVVPRKRAHSTARVWYRRVWPGRGRQGSGRGGEGLGGGDLSSPGPVWGEVEVAVAVGEVDFPFDIVLKFTLKPTPTTVFNFKVGIETFMVCNLFNHNNSYKEKTRSNESSNKLFEGKRVKF